MRGLMRFLGRTDDGFGGLILRLTLAAAMFPHGAQKALGWFGGRGLSATLEGFEKGLGLSAPLAVMVVAAEFLGPLLLLFGFLTRFAAASIVAVMVGAVQMAHWEHGFFMNWFGKQQGEGIEYHLLAIGIGLALVFIGAGRWSMDRSLSRE